MNCTKITRIVAIVQARMGSTRLPGKVLAEIQGHPMLWYVVERTRAAETVNEVVVATTTELADDPIVTFCREHGVACFRGSEQDVLDRYYQAALRYEADAVVRVTADCPLIDPEIIDKTVRAFLREGADYASNCVERTFPRGLDTEIFAFQVLDAAWRDACRPYERAHVTPYIYENPGRFKILSVVGDEDYSAYRWTVDTSEDLVLVRALYARFTGKTFRWSDGIRILRHEPALAEINRSVAHKALHEG